MDDIVQTKLVQVTPQLARDWLDLSEGNRRINPARVMAYVSDMQMGRWYLGETIKFSIIGLIDGHHRLNAVIKYGEAVKMLVTTGLPPDSIKGIDLGQPRTRDQVSKFMGEGYSRRHFAIARYMEFGMTTPPHYLTYDELRDYILKYDEAISFVIRSAGHEKYVTALVLAVAGRAYYHYPEDRSRLSRFIEVLRSGMPESKEDWAAQRYRLYIEDAARQGQRPKESDLYWRIESAVSHFMRHNPIALLRPANKELFPLKMNGDNQVVPA